MPLCKSCNSSKGTRDLLAWWIARGKTPVELDPDVLVSYCRVTWLVANRCRKQNLNSPPALAATVRALYDGLPSDEHRQMLRQRVSWITGRRWQ